MPVTGKKRLAGIELLRILAMIMIVIMHFLRESGGLLASDQLTAGSVQFLGTLLESFCIVAVNAYVFISGYFGCQSEFKLSKVITFLCQIWFYSLLVPVALLCLGRPVLIKEMGIYGLIQYVLPIESESYWFATSYFLLMLLMPLLNAAVKNLTRKQLQTTLLLLFLVFCGIKSICPIVLAFDNYGYDLSWFICIYLLAAYFRVYGADFLERHAWKIYIGSSLLIFGMTVALWYVLRIFPGAAYYFTVPFHYNFILCLTGAAGLFYGFFKIDLKEGRTAEFVRKIGKYSFGVYLLHEHPDVRYGWYPFLRNIINPSGSTGIFLFFGELIFSVVILFAAGLIIEWIRNLLFDLIRRTGRREYADRK